MRRSLPLLFAALLVLPAPVAARGATDPQPQLGRKFVVAQVSGKVFIQRPGAAQASRLTGRTTIPVGTKVNATKGRVRLEGATTRTRRATGEFWLGAFVARQARKKGAVIDLRLAGGDFSACDRARTAGRRRSRKVRRLRGKAKGNFRTRGNHSAATVRGTEWVTADRCGSSVVETRAGKVLASAGVNEQPLEKGEVFESTCVPPIESGEPLQYCIVTYYSAKLRTFGVSIGTYVHDGEYTICVDAPPPGDSGDVACWDVPFRDPEPGDTFRISALGCAPDQGSGTYMISWFWQGQVVGELPVDVTNPWAPGEGFCLFEEQILEW